MDLYENNLDSVTESILYNAAFNDTFKKIYPLLSDLKRTHSEEEARKLSQLTDIFFSALNKYIHKSYRAGFKDGDKSSLSGK